MLTKWVVLSLALAAFVHWTGPKVDAYAHGDANEELEEVERELLDAVEKANKMEERDMTMDCEEVCELANDGDPDMVDPCYQCVAEFCSGNPEYCDDMDKRNELGEGSETNLRKKAWIRIPSPRIPTPRIPVPRIPTPRIPIPRIPVPRIPIPRIPTPRIPIPRIPSPSRWFKKK